MGQVLTDKERRERAASALAALEDFMDAGPALGKHWEQTLEEAASVLRLYKEDGDVSTVESGEFYVCDNVTGHMVSRDYEKEEYATSVCATFNLQAYHRGEGGRYGVYRKVGSRLERVMNL